MGSERMDRRFDLQEYLTRGVERVVADAVKAMGRKLSRGQTAKAVALVQTLGTNMYAMNLAIFARFVVNCKLTDQDAAADRTHAEDMAGSIRKWRDFGYDEPGMEQFLGAIKDYANNDLNVARGRPDKWVANDPSIYKPIVTDANRSTFTINGMTIDRTLGNRRYLQSNRRSVFFRCEFLFTRRAARVW